MKKIIVGFTSSYLSEGQQLPDIEKKIIREFRSAGSKVIPFNLDEVAYISGGQELKIYAGKQILNKIDILMIRRTRNRGVESFELAHVMEQMGKTVIDSSHGIEYSINKIVTDPHLFQQKFYPKTILIRSISKEILPMIRRAKLSYPLIIKPQTGTKQRGVKQAQSDKELLAYPKKYQKAGIIIQEKVNTVFEYRVMVIGGKSIGAVRKEKDYLYRKKKKSDFKYVKNRPIERFAEEVVKHLPGDIYGVDVAEDVDGKLFLFESNRNPSFADFEKRSGINVEKKIVNFVLKKHRQKLKKKRI